MLETPSIPQYEPTGRDNLLVADNQQGSQEDADPSTTIRTAPEKRWNVKSKEGYKYDENLKRWCRLVTATKAFCTGCKQVLSLSKFSKVRGKPHHYCKDCTRLMKAKSRYGISLEHARQLYAKEVCDCCGQPFEKQTHKHIHHVGNKVKGLVCLYCHHTLRDASEEHLQRLKCCMKFIEQGEDRV